MQGRDDLLGRVGLERVPRVGVHTVLARRRQRPRPLQKRLQVRIGDLARGTAPFEHKRSRTGRHDPRLAHFILHPQSAPEVVCDAEMLRGNEQIVDALRNERSVGDRRGIAEHGESAEHLPVLHLLGLERMVAEEDRQILRFPGVEDWIRIDTLPQRILQCENLLRDGARLLACIYDERRAKHPLALGLRPPVLVPGGIELCHRRRIRLRRTGEAVGVVPVGRMNRAGRIQPGLAPRTGRHHTVGRTPLAHRQSAESRHRRIPARVDHDLRGDIHQQTIAQITDTHQTRPLLPDADDNRLVDDRPLPSSLFVAFEQRQQAPAEVDATDRPLSAHARALFDATRAKAPVQRLDKSLGARRPQSDHDDVIGRGKRRLRHADHGLSGNH